MKNSSPYADVLKKILASSTFSSSELYSNLLTFLYEKSVAGQSPKESTIAIEFFGKDSSFNTSEHSLVRFHMHKLRKKLEAYYQSEGETDPVRLAIPKGHYELRFEPRSESPLKKFTTREYVLAALLFAGIITIILLIMRQPHAKISNPIPKNDPLWSSFFDNDLPIHVVIGDYYIFEEWDAELEYYRRVMDYWIDEEGEFSNFEEEHPERRLKQFPLGELPHNSIYNLKSLDHVFYSFEKDYDIKMTRFLQPGDISGYNIIYVGELRHLRLLEKVVSKAPVKLHHELNPYRSLTILNTAGDTLQTFHTKNLWSTDSLITDYGVVAKLPGFRDEDIILLCGFGYISQIELVNLVCFPEKLEVFYREMCQQSEQQFPEYFISIFRVEGYHYTNYRSTIEYFLPLE